VSPHFCRLYVIKVLRIKVAKFVLSLLEARVNRVICRLCIPSTQARLLSTFLWDVKSNFGYLCLLSMLKGVWGILCVMNLAFAMLSISG
jgi:hypothetical protein